jgi:predicted NBD/HSP70 family sugar kinase
MESYIGRNVTFSLMKQLNIEKVYKLILLKHPIARTNISEMSGLNKVTVSNCVDFLMQHGVIEETGVSKPSGGRPPILLDLEQSFGAFIGVEYNTISSPIIVTDITGAILQKSKMTKMMLNPEEFVDETVKVVNYCRESYRHMKMGVFGVCMATPNNYNAKTGVVEDIAGRPEWRKFPIRRYLQEQLGNTPLFMQHVSSAAALGEIHFGNSNPMTHLAYLYGAWGLNLTMYAAGNIYEGSGGFSGRFGHTVIEPNGRHCACGNRGCLEAYSSVHSLMERLYPEEQDRMARDPPYRLELLTRLHERLKNKERKAIEALREMSDYLVLGISNIVNIFNPAQICIGGYLSTIIDDDTLGYIRDRLFQTLPAHFTRNLSVIRSQLSEYASVFGCVSAIRNRLVDILVNHERRMGYLDFIRSSTILDH